MKLDIPRVRAEFPALLHDVAYFDGPGGSQTPRVVADAVASLMCAGVSNRGIVTAAERRAEDAVVAAREAIAALLGGRADGVVFGRSMTQLTFDLARALSRQWVDGDEIIVTRLDHDANIRPWVRAADSSPVTVRWAPFDRQTGELPVDAVAGLLSPRTRLVALTAASNLLGTRPDVAAIAAAAHDVGAVVYVDGVHLTPHASVDVATLGADFFACSPYKFFGPHLGVVHADADLLATIWPDKLLPASDQVPDRFELGTLPYELLAGVEATVAFIAELVPADPGDAVRDRLVAAMSAVEEYEDGLFERLVAGLDAIDGIQRHGRPARHTPTVLFSVRGLSSQQAYESLAARGVNAPAGSFYALEASRWLGLGDAGAIRVGLAPYTDDRDVDRLLSAVRDLTGAAAHGRQ